MPNKNTEESLNHRLSEAEENIPKLENLWNDFNQTKKKQLYYQMAKYTVPEGMDRQNGL